MTSKLAKLLNLSAEDQQSIAKTSGRIRTVAEFLTDIIKATEKVDFAKALIECTPWWLQAVGESVAEAAPPIKFLATLIGKIGEIKDPDRLAFLAFTTAYQRSVEKALLSVGPPTKKSAVENKITKDDILTPKEGMSFNNYSIADPFNHLFLKQATILLNRGMKAAGYNENEIRMIQNEVLIRFPGCLRSLVTHPETREKFAAFADSLNYGNKESRVNAAWIDHFEYQRYQFEDKCVFGEEPFSLSDIYIETECGSLTCGELWGKPHNKEETDTSDSDRFAEEREFKDPFNEQCGGRHNLLMSVMGLIGNKSFRDAIVIQGPAGSGKSAFTLRLAMELLRSGLKPIRIRFRDIPLQSMNIEDALPEAVRFWGVDQRAGDLPSARPDELFLEMAIFDQTVKYGNADICPYVLILDGWDEVSVAAQKGFAVRIAEILAQIRDRFLTRGNRPLVRVVLTGRPSTAISSSSFLTKQTQLLTIRPLEPSALQAFVENLANRFVDPKEPYKADPKRFKSVLSSYSEEFQERYKEYPLSKRKLHIMEVLGLPLLTHLAVRLMVRWPDSDLSPLVENPTTLYRQLTNLTCEKGGRYGKEVFDPGIPGEDLRNLLHETAAAMTVFGRDSIPYDELDIRLSQMNEELLERVQRVTKEHPVSSLMINFFFKGGRTELGAEFLHKSFREFLYAEAVVESLKRYGKNAPKDLPEQSSEHFGKDFDAGDPRYELSRRIGSLLAPQWLTEEVCTFIEGLICWELARSHGKEIEKSLGATTERLSLSKWRRIADGLADLWNWWGEGVHLRSQPKFLGKKIVGWESPYVDELVHWAMQQDLPKGQVPIAPRTTSMDGHLGDGIFRLAALVHHYLAVAPGDNSKWQINMKKNEDTPKVRRYQSASKRNGKWTVRFAPSGPDRSYFFNYAARINAVGWHPGTVFPSGLFMESVDFSGCFLAVMGFASCRLKGANFDNANLTGAYFMNSDLSDINLHGAFARGAAFLDCKLHGANIGDFNTPECVFADSEPVDMLESIRKMRRHVHNARKKKNKAQQG